VNFIFEPNSPLILLFAGSTYISSIKTFWIRSYQIICSQNTQLIIRIIYSILITECFTQNTRKSSLRGYQAALFRCTCPQGKLFFQLNSRHPVLRNEYLRLNLPAADFFCALHRAVFTKFAQVLYYSSRGRDYPIWPCIPDMQHEGQFGQIVRKFDKKSYTAQTMLKIDFAHTRYRISSAHNITFLSSD